MKRLLISIPSGPHGVYDQQLAWWLTAVQIQSTIKEFGDIVADKHDDLAARLAIRKAAQEFGIAWAAEQAELQWQDGESINDLWAPMIPDGWSVAMAPVVGYPLAANRNEQARRFLMHHDQRADQLTPTDFDACLFIDTDNVPGRQDLHLMLQDLENDDVDILGGVYCMETKEAGPQPIVYTLLPDGKGFDYDRETLIKERGLHRLHKGGLPTGCLMVKRRVFERMWENRRVWFKDKLHDNSIEYHEIHEILTRCKDDPAQAYDALRDHANKHDESWLLQKVGSWHIGEDIWFCRMASEMGFNLWVDTRIFWKHIKKHDNKDTFRFNEMIGHDFFVKGARAAQAELTPGAATELYKATMAAGATAHTDAMVAKHTEVAV